MDPNKVYWISPERLNYSMNFQKETKFFLDCTEKMRGKILDGKWDKTRINFTDLPIYRNIKQILEKDEKLRTTDFFNFILNTAKSPNNFWNAMTTNNLHKLFEYFISLQIIPGFEVDSQKKNVQFKSDYYDAIDVNIGRNGEYLFQNNHYLLSIAKVLKVKTVPVRVFVRHTKWQKKRDFVINYLQNDIEKGLLYQPIVHPDFLGIPVQHDNKCKETMELISLNLINKNGIMLDIGANIGFFSHKFEDLGYTCYAVENDNNNFKILEMIKDAENKKFVGLNKSVFEVEFLKTTKFDVVLALNIFHHFLKTKKLFYKLKEFLGNLQTDILFLSTANCGEEQMRNAYQNYSESKFVDFILQHSNLNKFKLIFTGRYNRNLYKLSK